MAKKLRSNNRASINWRSLDWSKQNAALGRELNVPRQLVARWRAKLGKPPAEAHGKQIGRRRAEWDNVDWSKQNVVLAEELGVRPNTISRWRREMGGIRAEQHGKWRHAPQSKYNWEKVDWAKQDCQIAEELGTYSSTVAKWRKHLGKPRSPAFHKHRVHKARERYKKLNWKLQDIELAEQTGLTRERIRQLRIYFGAPKSPKHGHMRPRKPKEKAKGKARAAK